MKQTFSFMILAIFLILLTSCSMTTSEIAQTEQRDKWINESKKVFIPCEALLKKDVSLSESALKFVKKFTPLVVSLYITKNVDVPVSFDGIVNDLGYNDSAEPITPEDKVKLDGYFKCMQKAIIAYNDKAEDYINAWAFPRMSEACNLELIPLLDSPDQHKVINMIEGQYTRVRNSNNDIKAFAKVGDSSTFCLRNDPGDSAHGHVVISAKVRMDSSCRLSPSDGVIMFAHVGREWYGTSSFEQFFADENNGKRSVEFEDISIGPPNVNNKKYKLAAVLVTQKWYDKNRDKFYENRPEKLFVLPIPTLQESAQATVSKKGLVRNNATKIDSDNLFCEDSPVLDTEPPNWARY